MALTRKCTGVCKYNPAPFFQKAVYHLRCPVCIAKLKHFAHIPSQAPRGFDPCSQWNEGGCQAAHAVLVIMLFPPGLPEDTDSKSSSSRNTITKARTLNRNACQGVPGLGDVRALLMLSSIVSPVHRAISSVRHLTTTTQGLRNGISVT